MISPLKYGLNAQQTASVQYDADRIQIINGQPGYINMLDAISAWCCVSEIKSRLSKPAAASFKHVSPAGVAVAGQLTDRERKLYGADAECSPICSAYIRARNCDPQASFGDFVAVNECVDVTLAKVLHGVISDGIIAPDFTPEALDILRKKKQGNYLIIRAALDYNECGMESRTVWGITLSQSPNHVTITLGTRISGISGETIDVEGDLILASITTKYTMSNSIVFVYNGMCIGIGAGQQSRIRCTKLAAEKAVFYLARCHPDFDCIVESVDFKRQEKINMIEEIVESLFKDELLGDSPRRVYGLCPDLGLETLREYVKPFMSAVYVSSDGFFPNVDNLVYLNNLGVKYVVQPGGSVADDHIIRYCEEHGITMWKSDLRLFTH